MTSNSLRFGWGVLCCIVYWLAVADWVNSKFVFFYYRAPYVVNFPPFWMRIMCCVVLLSCRCWLGEQEVFEIRKRCIV